MGPKFDKRHMLTRTHCIDCNPDNACWYETLLPISEDMHDQDKYYNHNSKFHLQWSGLSQGLQIMDICQHCMVTVWKWCHMAKNQDDSLKGRVTRLPRQTWPCQGEENCCNVKPHEDYCLWLVFHSHGNSILPPQSSESTESRKHGSSMCPLPAELAGGTSQLKTRFTPGPGSDKILLLY